MRLTITWFDDNSNVVDETIIKDIHRNPMGYYMNVYGSHAKLVFTPDFIGE